MQVRREFKPEIAEKLETIPVDELESLLAKTQQKTEKETKPSRWAELAGRIKNDPDLKKPEFQKAWTRMKKNMEEFRREFAFKHDI